MSRNSYGTKEVNIIVPYGTTARNEVNDVGGGASKIVPIIISKIVRCFVHSVSMNFGQDCLKINE